MMNKIAKNKIALTLAGAACLCGTALAQSATVSLSSSAGTTVSPGDTVTITVSADYDTAGAPGGTFGAAGFYGFGGDVAASGASAGDVSAASASTNAGLAFGPVASTSASPDLARAAAGRGLAGGLGDNPASMFSFDLTIDPGAAEGSVTLEYTGAVVLVLGDDLTTFSSNPGLNQSPLTSNSLTLTIMSSSMACSLADITADGVCDVASGGEGAVTLSDFSCFLSEWANSSPIADFTTTGTCNPGMGGDGVDLSDFSCYLAEWSLGCP